MYDLENLQISRKSRATVVEYKETKDRITDFKSLPNGDGEKNGSRERIQQSRKGFLRLARATKPSVVIFSWEVGGILIV